MEAVTGRDWALMTGESRYAQAPPGHVGPAAPAVPFVSLNSLRGEASPDRGEWAPPPAVPMSEPEAPPAAASPGIEEADIDDDAWLDASHGLTPARMTTLDLLCSLAPPETRRDPTEEEPAESSHVADPHHGSNTTARTATVDLVASLQAAAEEIACGRFSPTTGPAVSDPFGPSPAVRMRSRRSPSTIRTRARDMHLAVNERMRRGQRVLRPMAARLGGTLRDTPHTSPDVAAPPRSHRAAAAVGAVAASVCGVLTASLVMGSSEHEPQGLQANGALQSGTTTKSSGQGSPSAAGQTGGAGVAAQGVAGPQSGAASGLGTFPVPGVASPLAALTTMGRGSSTVGPGSGVHGTATSASGIGTTGGGPSATGSQSGAGQPGRTGVAGGTESGGGSSTGGGSTTGSGTGAGTTGGTAGGGSSSSGAGPGPAPAGGSGDTTGSTSSG